MDEEYEVLHASLGCSVEDAVNLLLRYKSQGKLACMKFNDAMLFSDTVTMDSAYLQITGGTKAEHDAYLRNYFQEMERRKQEHQDNISSLTTYWIGRGKEVLPADKHKQWTEIVPIRLNDLYEGMELGNCIEIVEMLNAGGTLEEVLFAMSEQGHSGMSWGLVASIVREFSPRGEEFYDFIKRIE